jgi:hypothetical protein
MSIEERIPDFTGQSVAFYIAKTDGLPSWVSDGVVLDSPTLQKQGDRIFVVGRTTLETDLEKADWSDNREACLAWGAVIYYIVMPSGEYYDLRQLDDGQEEDVRPEKCEKPISKKRQLILGMVTALFLLILLAVLVALVIWIVKLI